MRLMKTFGLAVLTAVAAMAFAGATPASATNTQLCNEKEGLECGEATESVHMVLAQGTPGTILGSIVNVLCLGVLLEAEPLNLGQPQEVHTTAMSLTGCGTGSAHNNCTVTVEILPLANLLKTGLDVGSLTTTNGRVRLECSPFGIDCKYDFENLLFEVGAQHLTANKTKVTELGGKLVCPGNGELDWLLETLADTYVLG